MNALLSIDPGPSQSGWCVLRDGKPVNSGVSDNGDVLIGDRESEQSDVDKIARRKAQQKRAQDKYKAANREKLNAKQRATRAADPAKQAALMRAYRAKKPPGIAVTEARRVRPVGYREAFNAYRAEWAKRNLDKIREYAHKRSGMKLGRLPSGTLKAIGEKQKWKCAVCSGGLKKVGYHKDHIVPLSAGGTHVPTNIQLLCPPCNLSKGAKDPIDFMQSKGKLL